MTLLLGGLAACIAVTVVQILEKQRLTLTTCGIAMHVGWIVPMAEERYCSALATFPRGLIEHRVLLPELDTRVGTIATPEARRPATA